MTLHMTSFPLSRNKTLPWSSLLTFLWLTDQNGVTWHPLASREAEEAPIWRMQAFEAGERHGWRLWYPIASATECGTVVNGWGSPACAAEWTARWEEVWHNSLVPLPGSGPSCSLPLWARASTSSPSLHSTMRGLSKLPKKQQKLMPLLSTT